MPEIIYDKKIFVIYRDPLWDGVLAELRAYVCQDLVLYKGVNIVSCIDPELHRDDIRFLRSLGFKGARGMIHKNYIYNRYFREFKRDLEKVSERFKIEHKVYDVRKIEEKEKIGRILMEMEDLVREIIKTDGELDHVIPRREYVVAWIKRRRLEPVYLRYNEHPKLLEFIEKPDVKSLLTS
jgi:hypothetical protein